MLVLTVRNAALSLAVGAVFFCSCSDPTRPRWSERASELGVDFKHQSGARGEFHLAEIMGGGVALFDADGDGDLDLYLTNGNLDPATGSVSEGGPINRFYEWDRDRFVDRTERSGLGDAGYGMGVASGDIDNDGDIDLYVANLGRDRLFVNDGAARFAERTSQAGIEVDGWSSSVTFVDYDRDGLLDLYVARYVKYRPAERCTDAAGRPDYCGPSVFPAETDRLLHNIGNGEFRDVSDEVGLQRGIGHGLGVVAFDANDDARPDFYVANDGDANQLWIQREDGRFVDEALLRGVAYNQAGESEAGMGVIAEDLDADGHWDLFVTHLAEESNTIYRGGPQTFRDLSGAAGLAMPSLPYTSFGTVALDLDQDGLLDLAVANGRVSGGFERAAGWERFAEPNQFFRNLGAGRFEALPWGGGAAVSRGLAHGDLDADGDTDLVVANIEGPVQVWLNESSPRGRSLTVRAQLRSGRDANGAVVELEHQGRTLLRRIDGAGSYQSSSETCARFGLGKKANPTSLVVLWPDGKREHFAVAQAATSMLVVQGQGQVDSP